MKKFWIVFIVIALCVAGLMGLLWRLVNRLDTGPAIAGGVLAWRVHDAYAEERDDTFWGQMLKERAPLMREVVLALDRAGDDDDIRGLFLDIRQLPVSWAKVEELSDAVHRFRAKGKPVIAYIETAGTKEYVLAMAADEVIMAPEASLMILGVSAELSFMKETLAKLGMQADFVHVGKYKSAPESFTRNEPSAANREMMAAIVDARYQRLLRAIAAGRDVSIERAGTWIDGGLYDAPQALSEGLIDAVLGAAEVEETRFAEQDFTDLAAYAQTGSRGRAAAKVALIHTTGTIAPGKSRSDRWLGKIAGSETVSEQLRDAAEDDGIDAVILRVDSPGGSALASDLIWNEVDRLRQHKPVVVSMSGYAASGGYYISCGADSIFAEPGTLTGSIGVFAGKVDMKGFYDKIGVQREYITRGENALLFGNNAPFSVAQRARFEALLQDFYERFVGKVAAGRGLSLEEAARIAEGRVWTGEQALSCGLVDGLGGLRRAVTAAKHMIGLTQDDKVALISYERRLSFLERLLLRSLHESAAVAGLPRPALDVAAALSEDGFLAAVPLLDGRPLALMPYRIELR